MKQRIWMVVLLVIIAAISATLLNGIYVYTAPIISRNKELKLKKSVLDVFGIPYQEGAASTRPRQRVEDIFAEKIKTEKKEDFILYKLYSGSGESRKLTGLAFEIEGSGFWAPIVALLALEPDGVTIKGLKILEQAETPGLGARIIEPEFLAQFRGKKLKPHLAIVSYRKASAINEVDAITGATETSRALERVINAGVRRFYEKMGKGGSSR